MPDTLCKLQREQNEAPCNVADFIARQAQENPPLLAWADPDPTAVDLGGNSGRRADFRPLVRGIPTWPADVPLAEARLFWKSAALHVVAREGGGCRWARIEESNDIGEFMRSEAKVLTLRDRKRFGLETEADLNLRAIEYRQQGWLVAWRLTAEEE